VSISDEAKGLFSVVGHVGVGHVHSHSSFVQDDSAGFALVASLMREALGVDTRIKNIECDIYKGFITVETYGEGIGTAYARRGITPAEAELLKRAINEDGIYTQRIAVKTFGRMYGQGVMETPVAFQGAIALAVLDSFHKKSPDKVYITTDKYEGSIDKMAATIIDVDGIPVSLLLNINGSDGGIGPNEDNEGNTMYGPKSELMKRVGIDSTPTIIVESKAYIPGLSDKIDRNTFLFRAQESLDNVDIANRLVKAAKEIGIHYIYLNNALPQNKGQLAKATENFAERIIQLGQKLKDVDSSFDKVSIIADMAKLISEDAGGISFMSNSVHDEVRSPGIVPGTAAVISMLVPASYKDYWKIPVLDQEDIEAYRKIIMLAISNLLSKDNFSDKSK